MSVDDLVDAWSWWVFSDIFEEDGMPSQPFHGGPEGDDVLDQYVRFPGGKNDDEVDTAAVIGRAIDQAHPALLLPKKPAEPPDRYSKPNDSKERSWRVA